MDPILFCFSSSSDEEEVCNLSETRKQIRFKSDPLTLADSEFVKRFRLSKDAFNYVLQEIKFNGAISTSVPPKIQLAAALSLLASGGFQHTVGNDFVIGVSQSAISRILEKFIAEVETKLCHKFIKFCAGENDGCKEYFLRKYKIPGVIGCIDGTHIGLQKPKEKETMFFNRKTFHSLNSMVICDHQYRILAINSKNGGAAHDSFVWKKSNERAVLVENYSRNLKNGWLLGNN